MMKIKLIPLMLFLVLPFIVFSQEGVPIYSDYLADNMYLIHPSMAGAAPGTRVRLGVRQQWFDQRNAPNLQTFNISSRISERSALGGIFYNDRNGYHSQMGGYLTYAHHIPLSYRGIDLNQLSFGISAGMTDSRLDESEFNLDFYDPIIHGGLHSSTYINIDAGVSYHYGDFAGHFTVKNLLFTERKNYSEIIESANQRKYLLGGSYAFGTWDRDWVFQPSLMYMYTEFTQESTLDVSFRVFRQLDDAKIWAGASYRRGLDKTAFIEGTGSESQALQHITPALGVNFRNFIFSYMYSYQAGNVTFDNGGFHHITLGYNFGGNPNRNDYDCFCPNMD